MIGEKFTANNSHERRSTGVDISLVLRFIATSFMYLLAGLVLLTLNLAGILNLNRDAIFILWLFGFVAMIVFGLSYMFSSGLARSSAFINSTVSKEYILLNFGVVAFFIGFSGSVSQSAGKPIAITGLIAIMISVLLHLVNIMLISKPKKASTPKEKDFGDNY
ncbi:MAG: hypothetical protein ACYCSO_03240 [Cuniculiplasma sp.]